MIEKIIKKYSGEKGVSLIELVAAVAIFSLVATVASGIFINAIKAQKAISAKQNVAENLRYAMEFMVKELRMAKAIDISSKNGVFNTIKFNNSASPVHEIIYSLSGDVIKKEDVTGGMGAQPISSGEVSITSLDFMINNWDSSAAPFITILIKAKAKSGAGKEAELQAGVSPRIY